MSIAKITRKLFMYLYALTLTALFTFGLTGAFGLATARRTSFRPALGKLSGSRYRNWTEPSQVSHFFALSFTYSRIVVRDASVVNLTTGKSIHALFARERKR
jgi:hypothetical protein